MQLKETDLTAEYLRSILNYDPLTGRFTRNRHRAKRKVGSLHCQGYIQIAIDDVDYLAHRLAWLYMTGAWPVGIIDHQDRDRTNNRWSNLADVTQVENGQNSATRSDNSSGQRGVSWDRARNQWAAEIYAHSRHIRLGRFERKEDAIAVRIAAEQQYHAYVSQLRVCKVGP